MLRKRSISFLIIASMLIQVWSASGMAAAAVDTISAPVLSTATIDGNGILLTYDQELDGASVPLTAQYYVTVNGIQISVSSVLVTGAQVKLIMSSVELTGQAVTVSFTNTLVSTPGALKNLRGIVAANITAKDVTNSTDTTTTRPTGGFIDGKMLTLTFNKDLASVTNIRDAYQLYISMNGTVMPPTAVYSDASSLLIMLPIAFQGTGSVTVTYMPGANPFKDSVGNLVKAFSEFYIMTPNDTVAPVITSGLVVGNKVTLLYNEGLRSSSIPPLPSFIVQVNWIPTSILSIDIYNNRVVLTLSQSISNGQTILVTYFPVTPAVADLAGNPAQELLGYKMISSGTSTIPNVSTPNQPTLQMTLPSYLELDLEGGFKLNAMAVSATTGGTTPSDRPVNRYVVNSDQLLRAFQWVKASGSLLKTPTIAVSVPSWESGAVVQLPLVALISASSQVSNGAIRVDYGDLRFELPLSAVKYTQEVTALGGNLANSTLNIIIEKTTDSKLLDAITNASAEPLGSPAIFNVKIISGDKQSEVKQFDQYVSRTFVLPAGSAPDLAQLTVIRIDENSRELYYVPTVAESVSGSIQVRFKHKGNSTYAVVHKSPVVYSDMLEHWAKTDVSLLASKWIVSGTSSTAYSPDKAITRADFAKYIANGLGLTGNASSASRFKDVGASGKDASYIGAVSEAGIISGKKASLFDPNAPITREEMASMMLRAMNYAGVQPSNGSLTKFTDRSKIGSWATKAVAACVDAGIITGVTSTTFQPKANATRAQAAVMIVRMLQYSDLLQD